MSQQNVEIVKNAIEAFNRRDFDGPLEMTHPDVEWRPPAELPGTGMYHGHDGVRKAIG